MNILRLKDLLREKQVSGKELAKMVGVSQPAISDISGNKSFPRPELLLKISEALNVDVRELFTPTKANSLKIHLIIENEHKTFDSLDSLFKHMEELKTLRYE